MLRNVLRSLWAEPRVPDPPGPLWRDWALMAAFAPTAVLEAVLTDELAWRQGSLAVCLAMLAMVPWRRTVPLMAGLAFALVVAVEVASIVADVQWIGLNTNALVLILPYSLFRWGSGRDAAIGLAAMVTALILGTWSDGTTIGEALGGAVVLALPAALGASVRYRTDEQLRELDQVKQRERDQLARELHDSVAHHVSAIAIQAQAGLLLAPTNPDAAIGALEVIEEAASRTLDEMRGIVGALRRGEEAELAPQPGVADLGSLASAAGPGPVVEVEVEPAGHLPGLRPSVDAALYRLAQESITNAARHARRASRITVRVSGDEHRVRLTVTDDGDSGLHGPDTPTGFGLTGMAERAKLLGGSFDAGPGPDRGWTVTAVLPRNGYGP